MATATTVSTTSESANRLARCRRDLLPLPGNRRLLSRAHAGTVSGSGSAPPSRFLQVPVGPSRSPYRGHADRRGDGPDQLLGGLARCGEDLRRVAALPLSQHHTGRGQPAPAPRPGDRQTHHPGTRRNPHPHLPGPWRALRHGATARGAASHWPMTMEGSAARPRQEHLVGRDVHRLGMLTDDVWVTGPQR